MPEMPTSKNTVVFLFLHSVFVQLDEKDLHYTLIGSRVCLLIFCLDMVMFPGNSAHPRHHSNLLQDIWPHFHQ